MWSEENTNTVKRMGSNFSHKVCMMYMLAAVVAWERSGVPVPGRWWCVCTISGRRHNDYSDCRRQVKMDYTRKLRSFTFYFIECVLCSLQSIVIIIIIKTIPTMSHRKKKNSYLWYYEVWLCGRSSKVRTNSIRRMKNEGFMHFPFFWWSNVCIALRTNSQWKDKNMKLTQVLCGHMNKPESWSRNSGGPTVHTLFVYILIWLYWCWICKYRHSIGRLDALDNL